MATRPVFFPVTSGRPGVRMVNVNFTWVPGMAPAQRRKCMVNLHHSLRRQHRDIAVLEVSSKSDTDLGISLSAFNLGVESKRSGGFVCVESLYQCSKVFKCAGPFPAGYGLSAIKAREMVADYKDEPLTAFDLYGELWPLRPTRAFYNWVYCHALSKNPALVAELANYDCFTDIEFNPARSRSCQAYAVALYLSLEACGALKKALADKQAFLALHPQDEQPSARLAPAARKRRGTSNPAAAKPRPVARPPKRTPKRVTEKELPMTLFEQMMPEAE